MSLITEHQVVLDLQGPDRHTATRTLAETLVADGRCTDLELFLDDVRKREEQMANAGQLAIRAEAFIEMLEQ